MDKLLLLVLSLSLIGVGQALKCKKCKDVKCDDLEEETCQADPGKTEAACLTHVYKDVNKEERKNKGCVSLVKGSKYECNKTQVEEITCETCGKDYCNGSNGARGGREGWLGIVGVVGIFALLKVF